MMIAYASMPAKKKGVHAGMVVADARAVLPELEIIIHESGQEEKLLRNLALWCTRFSPDVAIDFSDGLMLDITGCTHLWGGEDQYMLDIKSRLMQMGYSVSIGIASTIGLAWAAARFGRKTPIVPVGYEREVLQDLPPNALRIEPAVSERLFQLGLSRIGQFMDMPANALRRRFGANLITRLEQALGLHVELIQPVKATPLYEERLPAMEPIRTATGIEIAIGQLLEQLCLRLGREEVGLRTACLQCFRLDGRIESVNIGTNRPSRNVEHLFRLFALHIARIEPDLGIELFVMQALTVEPMSPAQEALWEQEHQEEKSNIAALADRLTNRLGKEAVYRLLPVAQYWPELSVCRSSSLQEQSAILWERRSPRPVRLLSRPQAITVSVPLPDYPPILFIHNGTIHRIAKADGPERIEAAWWLESGEQRDYYQVEDESGARYWIFRKGHYATGNPGWYLHGYFA